MTAPSSSSYRGWYFDREQSTLDLYVGFGGASDPVEVLAVTTSAISPGVTDTVSLGTSALNFADLFLDSGAVINFNSSDVTLTHSSNTLTLGGGNLAAGANSITAGSLLANSNDVGAIGESGTAWSDLFLASGGVINFNAGDVTLTHASNTLTVGSGDLLIANGFGIVVGHTAGLVLAGVGTHEFQVVGTTGDDGGMLIGRWSASDSGPALRLLASRNTTIGSFTVVNDDDTLGTIAFLGDDGTDYGSAAAEIRGAVDGTPGAGDMPGRLEFFTTADGAQTATERWRITSVGYLTSLTADASNAANVDGGIIATGGIAFTDVANAWIDDASRGSGTVTHYIGTSTITVSSDLRIKTNIVEWQGSATELMRNAPRLVEFTWNDPSDTNKWGKNSQGPYKGWLAQETIDWAPWIVNAGIGMTCAECRAGEYCEHWSPDGLGAHPTWHVQYDHLVPSIVKSFQEIDERVLRLEGFQEHTENGWFKEQFIDLVENDDNFRAWAKEALAVT